MKKWQSTIVGIIGVVLTLLGVIKPEIFTAENNEVIIGSVTAIITAVLSIIAIFSDGKLSKDNVA